MGSKKLEQLQHIQEHTIHMKTEQKQQLPFLDVLIIRTPNDVLAQYYREKRYTDRYLRVESHHCPTRKMGLLHIMATREIRIAEKQNKKVEKENRRQVMQNNGYTHML